MTENTPDYDNFRDENIKTIFDCWNEVIKHFFDTKGRTTRYEYWSFLTVTTFIFLLAVIVGSLFGFYKIITEIFAIYFLAPVTCSSVRRLHDAGLSGYLIIPETILMIVTLCYWEFSTDFTILPIFLLLCYTSYLYTLLASSAQQNDNDYGQQISEAKIYNQDSIVFIYFMTATLIIMWIIFFVYALI